MGWLKRQRKPAATDAPSRVISTGLTLLVAATALPLVSQQPWPLTAYFAALLLLRLATLRLPGPKTGRLLLPFTLGGVALVMGQYHTLFGHQAGISLLALMLALKLLELRSERDLYVTVTLCLFLVVSQFLLDQSIHRAAWLLLVVVALTALLTAHNRTGGGKPGRELRYALTMLLQTLPLVVVLFLLFPRLANPLWRIDLGGHQGLTGLSDSMSPGAISRLIQSDAPAFRVQFDGEPPPPALRYWRGPVLWHTDGRRWSTLMRQGEYDRPVGITAHGSSSSYLVILESNHKRWLFALDLPALVPPEARMTGDFQLLAQHPVSQRRQYHMVSRLDYRTGPLGTGERNRALQLPATVSRRMYRLVQSWTAQGGGGDALAQRALAYFRRQPFVYTLTPPLLGRDPMDEFLFETRAGFCEHYAAAFTLLMRIGGVPARVVTGYLGGELNPVGGYFIVRQSDAHAWSEIWLEGRGWVRIDPTAAIAPERIEHSIDTAPGALGAPVTFSTTGAGAFRDLAHRVGLVLDALNTGWHRWILGYDSLRQAHLLDWMGLGGMTRYGMALMMIAVLLALVSLATLWLQKSGARRTADGVQRQYLLFRRRLAAAGIDERQTEGPADLAARVRESRPDLARPVDGIIALYVRLRYSGRGREEDKRRLRSLVGSFRPHKKR